MATTAPSKRFFPVIHCVSPWNQGGVGHALANTKIALENGADGVFLIGHKLRHGDLTYIYEQVRKQNPEAWVGINFLDLTTSSIQKKELLEAIGECPGLSALWMDALPEEDLGISSQIEIFGGVGFKYINPNPTDEELSYQCTLAGAYCSLATTSGEKTGVAVDIKKILKIWRLLGSGTPSALPIAVASGVDAMNIYDLLPFVSAFLVASSISHADAALGGHEYLVPERVRVIADIVHRYRPH